ncbi:MAG TPA: TolC family protein [Sedimentisphaerales bacterium]|nr:TolC family protein [Sedimentisphaerales bacterium]
MTYCSIRKFNNAFLWLALITLVVSGCSKEAKDYKADSDEKVYKILDKKWDPNTHGVKTNYKISDVEPDPQAIKVERAVPASGILTLTDAVAIATAHSREYQLEKENLYLSALDLNLTRHDFETQFFGGGSANYQYDDATSMQQINASPMVGFSRMLQDGTLITTDLTLAWVDILSGDFRSGLDGIFNAAINKPLLRGSQREIVMENLTQAERTTLYQIRIFSRYRKIFVVNIATLYYTTLLQHDRLINSEDNYAILTGVCDKAKKLRDVGRLPQYELDEALQDKLHAYDKIIEEEKLYKQMLDEFKLVLGLPTDCEFELDDGELLILKSKKMDKPSFSCSESITVAMNNRLDLLNAFDAIDDAARKVMVKEDAFRAQLNIVAGTSTNTAERRQSLRGLNNLDSQINAGVQLDLGLDKSFAQWDYRNSLIILNQARRFYQQTQDQTKLEVRNAYRDLTEAMDRHDVQVENLKFAKKRFDNTMTLLKYSRTNTRDVLDAQEDYFDAQKAAAETAVNYTIAMLNFYRDTDVMQIKPDGMW